VHKETRKVMWKDVLLPFKQWDIPVFAWVIYTPLIMATNAYFTTLPTLAGISVSKFVGTIQAWEFLFTLTYAAIGLYFQRFPALLWSLICFTILTIILGNLALVLDADNYEYQTVTGGIFIAGNGFIYATKYVFTEMVIDDMLFGTVSGIIATTSGVIDLTNIVWRTLLVDDLATFNVIYTGVATFSGAMFLIILWRIQKGKLEHLKFLVTSRDYVDDNDSSAINEKSLTSYYSYESEAFRLNNDKKIC